MTAKLKMYPRRIGWIGWNDGKRFHWKNRENGHQARVRVVDAREMTPENAVEKVLQLMQDVESMRVWIHYAAHAAGMTARVVNGKVRVRRVEK